MNEEIFECTNTDEIGERVWTPRYEACSKDYGDYEGASKAGEGATRVTRYLGSITMGKMLLNKVRIPEGFVEAEHIASKLKLNTCKVCGDTIFLTGCLTETINYVTSAMPAMPSVGDSVVDGQGQFHSKITCNGNPKVRRVENKTIIVDIPVSMSMKADFLENVRLRGSRNRKAFYNENTLQRCGRGSVGVCPCESFSEDFVVLNKGFDCDVEAYRVSQVDISKTFDFPPCGMCGAQGAMDGDLSSDGDFQIGTPGFCNKYFVIEEKMLLEVVVSVYMDELDLGDDNNYNCGRGGSF